MKNKSLQFARKLIAFFCLSWYTVFAQVGRPTNHPPPIRASFYATKFEGRLMANGQPYRSAVISAASLQFPLGSTVRVTNIKTGHSVIMPVTDRGPWHTRFSLDLSPAAFKALGFDLKQGWGWVVVERVK